MPKNIEPLKARTSSLFQLMLVSCTIPMLVVNFRSYPQWAVWAHFTIVWFNAHHLCSDIPVRRNKRTLGIYHRLGGSFADGFGAGHWGICDPRLSWGIPSQCLVGVPQALASRGSQGRVPGLCAWRLDLVDCRYFSYSCLCLACSSWASYGLSEWKGEEWGQSVLDGWRKSTWTGFLRAPMSG